MTNLVSADVQREGAALWRLGSEHGASEREDDEREPDDEEKKEQEHSPDAVLNDGRSLSCSSCHILLPECKHKISMSITGCPAQLREKAGKNYDFKYLKTGIK